ncbi:MAG: hypothetical protein N4A47_05920 [Clostridia bacterium]|jgi:hypothetical protein|nr:hypothetical protein [Clostridia bacterium]
MNLNIGLNQFIISFTGLIFILEILKNMIASEQKSKKYLKVLLETPNYIKKVKHKYYYKHIIDDDEVAEINNNQTLNFIKEIIYLSKEYGDIKENGKSIFISNLNLMIEYMKMEEFKYKLRKYFFKGANWALVLPIIMLLPSKGIVTGIFPELDEYFSRAEYYSSVLLFFIITYFVFLMVNNVVMLNINRTIVSVNYILVFFAIILLRNISLIILALIVGIIYIKCLKAYKKKSYEEQKNNEVFKMNIVIDILKNYTNIGVRDFSIWAIKFCEIDSNKFEKFVSNYESGSVRELDNLINSIDNIELKEMLEAFRNIENGMDVKTAFEYIEMEREFIKTTKKNRDDLYIKAIKMFIEIVGVIPFYVLVIINIVLPIVVMGIKELEELMDVLKGGVM